MEGEEMTKNKHEDLDDYEKNIMKIKDSGQRTDFSTGAVRDMHTGKGRMDLLPWYAIMEVSKHSEEGALKYGERNVDKGIPIHSFLDSAFRHLAEFMEGQRDEPHMRAAAWNILWAIQTMHDHPELQDIPKQQAASLEWVKHIPIPVVGRCDEDWNEEKENGV